MYLSSANFKVVVVDVDGGDGVASGKLPHTGIRQSFSCLWGRHNLTDHLDRRFLLLSCSLQAGQQGRNENSSLVGTISFKAALIFY